MGFQLQSTSSEWTRLSRYYYKITRRHIYSMRYLNCHTWIKETGHYKITLLLQLNYDLQNSLLILKHPEGGCPRGWQPHTGCVRYGSRFHTFSFLVFVLWSPKMLRIVWKIAKQNCCPRRCAMFWNGFMYALESCAFFSVWDMVNFVLELRSELRT